MGWVKPEDRRALRKKFKVKFEFEYLCNKCKLPIQVSSTQLMVTDVKRGFKRYKLKTGTVRKPKRTYHQDCYEEVNPRIAKHKQKRRNIFGNVLVSKPTQHVAFLIAKKKPAGYWTKSRLIKKLGTKVSPREFNRAITYLKREHKIKKSKGGYIIKKRKLNGDSSR